MKKGSVFIFVSGMSSEMFPVTGKGQTGLDH